MTYKSSRTYSALRAAAVLVLCVVAVRAGAEPGGAEAAAAPPTPATPPLRVLSCAPNLTEIAFDIGAGEMVVGVDKYSTEPAAAAALPRIGDLFSPDLERMLTLRPDVILTVPSNLKVREFFTGRAGVRLVECNDANTLRGIEETYHQIGRELGREEGARDALARIARVFTYIDHRVTAHDAIRRDARPPRTVLLLMGRAPGLFSNLLAVSGRTYIGELVARLGFRHVVPPELPYWAQITLEQVLRWNPDVLVELQGEESSRPKFVIALRNDWATRPMTIARAPESIYVIDSRRMAIPGPAIARAYADLAAALRPGVFGAVTGDVLHAEALAAKEVWAWGEKAAREGASIFGGAREGVSEAAAATPTNAAEAATP